MNTLLEKLQNDAEFLRHELPGTYVRVPLTAQDLTTLIAALVHTTTAIRSGLAIRCMQMALALEQMAPSSFDKDVAALLREAAAALERRP
jgi:hypothetical protein